MEDLLVTWLDGLTLAGAWERVAGHLPGDAVSLIACLDSSREPARSAFLMERARAADAGAVDQDGRIVLAARALAPLVDDPQVFAGYDEVYVFARRSQAVGPPPVALTSEEPVGPDPRLASWFADTGCLLGLGDGYGLNYATPSRTLAGALEEAG